VTFVLDTPTWCLYSAEGSIDPGVVFPNIATARAMLRRILRSRWWRDRYPDGPRILLRRRSIVDDDGGFESFARPVTEWLPTAWRIELHEAHLNPMVLMHEIAHCIAPRWTGNVAEIHRDRATGARRAHHDGVFAAIYSEMVGQFGTGTNSADLAEAYAHYGRAGQIGGGHAGSACRSAVWAKPGYQRRREPTACRPLPPPICPALQLGALFVLEPVLRHRNDL